MQTVGADQGEEGRQEGRTLRRRAFVDHVMELIEFDTQEGEAEETSNGEPEQGFLLGTAFHLQHRETVGDRREQEHGGVDCHELQVEQVGRRWAGRIIAAEHGIGRE
ncbi:hypothetical protein D3C73_429220 [compost metagenome]